MATMNTTQNSGTPKGISAFEMSEIIRKAQSGIQMDKPTAQKTAIYNQYANVPAPGQQSQGNNFANDYMNQLNAIYDQQRQAQVLQYTGQRNKAIGEINQQKAELAPAYADKRNQADVVNAQNVQRLRELMAANGISGSGENVTSQTALGAARQGALSQLNLQEQQQRNDYDRRIADLNDPTELHAMMLALEADRMRSTADAQRYANEQSYQRERDAIADGWRQNQWNYQAGRDSIGDQRYNQQFGYQQQRDQVGDRQWQQQFNQSNNQWQQQFNQNNSQWQQQFNQSQQQYADERAWRQYTYNNMSAAERARMDQAASQFGEEMAWRMYSLEYQGEIDKSTAEAQLGAYGKGNFNVGTGLGALSQKYESSGNPGVIANNSGDIGGKSYGMYQLATNMGTPKRFVDYLKKANPGMAKAFEGRAPGSAAFDSAWKTLATTQRDAFAAAQHNFTKVSYFDPVAKQNPWVLQYPKAVQDAVWSTAVQHGVGGANNILKKINVGMTPQSVINTIYNERGANNGMKYFPSSSASIRQSVLKRFENERKDALSMLR